MNCVHWVEELRVNTANMKENSTKRIINVRHLYIGIAFMIIGPIIMQSGTFYVLDAGLECLDRSIGFYNCPSYLSTILIMPLIGGITSFSGLFIVIVYIWTKVRQKKHAQ